MIPLVKKENSSISLTEKYPSLNAVHKKILDIAQQMLNYHQDALEILRSHQVHTRGAYHQKPFREVNKVAPKELKLYRDEDIYKYCENIFVRASIPFHTASVETFQTLTQHFKSGIQPQAETLKTLLDQDLPSLLKQGLSIQMLGIDFIFGRPEKPEEIRKVIFQKKPKPELPRHREVFVPAEQSPIQKPILFKIDTDGDYVSLQNFVFLNKDKTFIDARNKELRETCNKTSFIAVYESAPQKVEAFYVEEDVCDPSIRNFDLAGRTHSMAFLSRGVFYHPLKSAETKQVYRFCLRREHLSQAVDVDKKKVKKLQQLLQLYQTYAANPPKVPTISLDQHVLELAQLTSALEGTKLSSKKVEEFTQQHTPVKAQLPVSKSEPVAESTTRQFTLPPKMHEIFAELVKHTRKVSWNEAVECLSHLGFAIRPVGGSIYKFQYQDISALIQEESDGEYLERVTKNVHMPHDKGQDAKTPLSPTRLNRFRLLLAEANMTLETVLEGKSAKKLTAAQ